MQGLSLALVIAFGAAALIGNDGRFMMAKPSVTHFAVGAVMLRPGWMIRYMPPTVSANVSRAVLTGCGYAWAALMLALGALNLHVALHVAAAYDVAVWAWFISVGAVGAKLAALAAQMLALRILVHRRLRAGNGPMGPDALPKAPRAL